MLLPLLWVYRIRVPSGAIGLEAVFRVVPFCLIVTGQAFVSSGLASILKATTPLSSSS